MKNQFCKFIALVCLILIANSAFGQTADPDYELKVAIQKICPVSGKKLGSMGDPVKVKLGDEISFLCCKGCLGKAAKSEHWNVIQKNLAAAQKTCPIMNKPVDATMKSTVVNNQRIFVCCPPCIEKIKKDSDSAIAKVNSNYKAFVAAQANGDSDALQVAAQEICPVSGSKLGSMGEPVKVKVGKEHVFVCCKACLSKKIDLKHWKTIQENLAKAQGVCPIMKESVDGSKKFAVVNGRKIFVCCPPCIEKIEAKPEDYLTVLNQLLMKSIMSKK